ncbi:SGNH/GDSL hydrolase family protein [uncultured Limosilactobacillus sp.]|uniref:SGNH/GDSL hydrolase family protein n=1 Tax=uncultured Limosilactobacillus sp. TaxID=2837629 RepID=UPI00259668C5|nr:SGNH/GDSL hydrolase family protein [uncultured Limosilactobacillus sp.]
MKRKWWLGLLLLCLLAVLGSGWYFYNHLAGQRSAEPVYVQKKNVHLVAVGDSLTFGQGDETKNGGYVGIIKQKIEHRYRQTTVETANYGVSGDRSEQILARLNAQKTMRQDLRQADVITMTVGGNDLLQNLEKNVLNSPQTIDKDVAAAQQTYTASLNKLLQAVRKENRQAPIFVLSIYNPVYTYFPDVDTINDSIAKWNTTTAAVTRGYKQAYFVDINHLMSWGQYKTAAQRQQLVRKEEQANRGKVTQARLLNIMKNKDHNLNQYISTEDNFHPNHRGYEQMADRLFQAMQRHDSWEYVKR